MKPETLTKASTKVFCPWDQSWHDTESDLLQYCRGRWIPEDADLELLKQRLLAVFGAILSAQVDEPKRELPENTPIPSIDGATISTTKEIQ